MTGNVGGNHIIIGHMPVNVGANHITIGHMRVNVGARHSNLRSYDSKCRC